MKLTVPVLLALATLAAPAAFAQMSHPGGGDPIFDSGELATGETFSWTFNETGTFTYHCHIHPNMKGTVQVAAGGPSSTAVAIINGFFAPPTASIGPGGTVSWTNVDSNKHTVTADAMKMGNATHGGMKAHPMGNATIDRVPPEAASKGLARAEDARLFGKLAYANASATGRFVSFNYTEST